MKIRLADYVAQFLQSQGLSHVFMVTGGGAMHLNDAFGRTKDMEVVCCHHEQACSMAAESYFRLSGKMAAVNVTTGPGGTNAITGVYGAYVDSMAMFVVSGQVKHETLVVSTSLNLRQLGDQEVNIIEMVKGVTKYSALITDPDSIRYHLEKAYYLALNGRPGPVWLDIPMNVQGALIDPEKLVGFNSDELKKDIQFSSLVHSEKLDALVEQAITKLAKAERPVVMLGSGVRIAGQYSKFLEVIQTLGIPVTTCWNAHDALETSHPLFAGKPGTIGDRVGNFAVQNSDCVLVLGSRLNIRQISYNWDSFARYAYKIMVDIDEAELKKPTLKIDLPICTNLTEFYNSFLKEFSKNPFTNEARLKHLSYLNWCKERVKKYNTVLPEYFENKVNVNPYVFVNELFNQLPEDQVVVTGDGTACVVTFQAANLKKGQRLYTNSGCASMGFDLPAAIGASFATQKSKKIVCIAGDGSIQMNLQELQTLVTHQLPVKLFVLYNKGYHSIRQTQHNFFKDNIVGCGEESGLGFPSFEKLAAAYGYRYIRISSQSELKKAITNTLMGNDLTLCEVVLNLDQQFSPKLSSRKLPDGKMVTSPLEDMAPFLSKEELQSNLFFKAERE